MRRSSYRLMATAVTGSSARAARPPWGIGFAMRFLYKPPAVRESMRRGVPTPSAELGQGVQYGSARHVVDETEGADLGRQDERHAPILRLFVPGERLDHTRGVLAHAAYGQAYGLERRELPRACGGSGQSQALGDCGLGGDPEGHSLAVGEA